MHSPSAHAILSSARHLVAGLLDVAFPPKCHACGRLGPEALCATCRAGFVDIVHPACQRCGLPGASLCRACRGREAFRFERAIGAGLFEGTLRAAILRLKYDGRRRLAEPLGGYLAEALQRAGDLGADLVAPVPLHRSRYRQRGFNQSELLARPVAVALGLPLEPGVLRRTRRTRVQALLRASERERNVRGAFAASCPETVSGRRILLVDDVLTTLHTADECARVLIEAGASVVVVAGVAHG
ncbi:MAG TPA: ComF family protein [Chthonomonadales bacterium]|nr:ComF family protein [Chthonomonadales bacterium]